MPQMTSSQATIARYCPRLSTNDLRTADQFERANHQAEMEGLLDFDSTVSQVTTLVAQAAPATSIVFKERSRR